MIFKNLKINFKNWLKNLFLNFLIKLIKKLFKTIIKKILGKGILFNREVIEQIQSLLGRVHTVCV